MRTTIDIDDEIMRAIKLAAVKKGKSLRALVQEMLENAMHLKSKNKPFPYKCPTFSLGFPQGVNLDKALDISTTLETEEIARKLALRK
jgi:hypothetical protein